MRNPMTVSEFIEVLKKYDPDALVWAECEDEYYSCLINADSIRKGELFNVLPYEYECDIKNASLRMLKAGPPYIIKYPGGWSDDPVSRPFSEKKPAVMIRVE